MTTCPCCGHEIAEPLSVDALGSVAMTEAERRLLGFFIRRYPKLSSTDAAIADLYWDNPNGGPLAARNIIEVHVHRINRKITPLGWRIRAAGKSGRVLARVA